MSLQCMSYISIYLLEKLTLRTFLKKQTTSLEEALLFLVLRLKSLRQVFREYPTRCGE